VKNRRGDTETRRQGDRTLSPRVSASPLLRVPLITLLTDFGTSDYFVSAVKGVILSSNPEARLVDITHDVPPQDIDSAAFTLLAACSSFPPDTIHLAVVDPGVGSSRRAILIQARQQYFVGPDNGIFSYVCEREENRGLTPEIFQLTNTKYFHTPVSVTFNGRDLFAPVAAALSQGTKPGEFGTRITDIVRLSPLKPEISRAGRIKARIIHIDRFGNCVTNITQKELTPEMIAGGAKLQLKKTLVTSFRNYFSEETGNGDKVFGVWGSADFLEIAVSNNSAAKLLKVKRGDSVTVSGI
jgi:S-adenosylmethionine hydrolase